MCKDTDFISVLQIIQQLFFFYFTSTNPLYNFNVAST